MSKLRRTPSVPQSLTGALVAACLFAPAASGQAQSPSPQPPSPSSPSPGQPGATANIPEQKLDAAAAALQRVVAVKQDYERRLNTANDSDKQQLIGEAQNALSKAVTDQGLSVEEYTAIIVTAQNDPTVREKILQRLPPAGNQPDSPSGK